MSGSVIPLFVLLMMASGVLAAMFMPVKAWRWVRGVHAISAVLVVAGLVVGWQPAEAGWFSHSLAHGVLMAMVALLGYILVAFSDRYLSGDPGRQRFLIAMQSVLTWVMLLISTNHIGVLMLGWIGVSVGTHRLLLHYPDRPRAALAAHKKRLFMLFGDLMLVVGLLILAMEAKSPWIEQINASVVPSSMTTLAACLLVMAALIKCAQMPLHGWLIQVVESPTPVSALLHAGVINLGGVMLLAFPGVLAAAPLATAMLIVVAGISLLLATLVMDTRISIKVRLAWSTCAQMAFLLIEIALGLYTLALLHLLAHSSYKAMAFLSAGSAVDHWKAERRFGTTQSPGSALSLGISGCGLFALGVAAGFGLSAGAVLLLCFALLVLPWFSLIKTPQESKGYWLIGGWIVLLSAVLYGAQSQLLHQWMTVEQSAVSRFALVWLVGIFLLLTLGFWIIRWWPKASFARPVHRLLFAGLYLDEWASRLTLRIWPAQLPGQPAKSSQSVLLESGK
ncbi:NADH-quinone oxidoreductase subunit L [Aestuariibacter halophilus]|uniref:Probable inorganic carbon transporter subunit DabB n=1 Tax=Fluctibacter halophilus TaxID=226011 RepID=A0ABS8GCJ9_9ALTE|nr:NADH-quinone oxidoreductase subunit L [Aestuariibacter halophilus]MCC2618302.1 NADH-quinone oxidoreductase subunit L [Aestuariibacter halophilus]